MVDFILVPPFGGGAAPEVGLDTSTPGGYRQRTIAVLCTAAS